MAQTKSVPLASGLDRWWFGLTAFTVLAGLVIQLLVTAQNTTGHFATPTLRVLNVFCFFTIQSNILVGLTSLGLVLKPRTKSVWFWGFRLSGLIAIIITGVVYHSLLRGLDNLHGWALVSDNLLHTVVPLLTVIGWLWWGPQSHINRRVIYLAIVFPSLWLLFTIIRGAMINWYPYPFMDVTKIGYARTILNTVGIAVLFLACATTARYIDGWLPKQHPSRK